MIPPGRIGRPRGEPTGRIPDRLPLALIERIEAWRLAQPIPPSKVDAIAYLLQRALDSLRRPQRRK
jgi:hypothetical protein